MSFYYALILYVQGTKIPTRISFWWGIWWGTKYKSLDFSVLKQFKMLLNQSSHFKLGLYFIPTLQLQVVYL